LVKKCATRNLVTCGDILELQNAGNKQIEAKEAIGEKTWAMLCAYSRGQDDRILENKERQSVGAEINWGIRFQNANQVETFMREFSEEVFNRLVKVGLSSSHVTVNVKKKLYQGEPPKFLGCGRCEDFSKSIVLPSPVDSPAVLFRHAQSLLLKIAIKPDDIRGIGIHLKKLPASNSSSRGSGKSIADMFANNRSSSSSNISGMAQLDVFASNSEDGDDFAQVNDIEDDESKGVNISGRGKQTQQELAYMPVSMDRTVPVNDHPLPATETKLNSNNMATSQQSGRGVTTTTGKKRESSSPPGSRSITSFFKKSSPGSASDQPKSSNSSSSYSEHIDPSMLAALPADIRLELQSAGFQLQTQQTSAKPIEDTGKTNEIDEMCAELEIDPTFLAALPEDIRMEQLQWMRQQPKRTKIS